MSRTGGPRAQMMNRLVSVLCLTLMAAGLAIPTPSAIARKAPQPSGIVRVKLETSAGPIVVAVDTRRAPKTAENFLAYVDDGRFDGTKFYRAARAKYDPRQGFIQGGIETDARRILPPFPLETTAQTGILHMDGTISMARREDPDSAGGNYFICIGRAPHMDAQPENGGPGKKGFAAFGRVVQGMDVVRRILALPTGGGTDGMRGQMLLRAVRVTRAVRLDGTPRPTGRVKPWLIKRPT